MAISKVNSPYTKIQDVPDVPTIGTATEGAESAEVAFTPAVTGGKAYQYRALSNPGGIEAISPSSPILIEGLTADISYNFQVRAESNTGATNGYSSASNSIVPTSSGAYQLLETVTLTSESEGLTFENISQNYKHLQVRCVLRGSGSASVETHLLRLNEDNSSVYASHYLWGNGGSVSSSADTSQNLINMGVIVGGGGESNAFTSQVMDILDYTSTSKYKTTRSLMGHNYNLDDDIRFSGGLWQSTSAVNSITFLAGGSEVYAVGSRFSLYGIRAA